MKQNYKPTKELPDDVSSSVTLFIVSPCSGSSHNGSESDQSPDDTAGKDDSGKKQKLSFGYVKKSLMKPEEKVIDTSVKKGIQIKLGTQKPIHQSGAVKSQSSTVAAAFNLDEEEEPEEMPPEARMRMRNIGRETPTSAGPNSFGKTKQGFCDAKKIFEKTMKKAMDSTDNSKKTTE
ncbi:PEST proteolytic signal-containing nuclear protein-like isoform X1 [Zootermopsis nevadensis]|uniref:PEST proteolytic signal-containing nuclear protein-like isoform X1 n=2 Tax=Zootermopsis nevadensis TaxID=136037 RepID=UPI000B8E9FE6|nr:PEST proteolytic signal-containing nuclear protein-like isoform X1 [Zootermopsis nevadensis]